MNGARMGWNVILYIKWIGPENLVISISEEDKRRKENDNHTCVLRVLVGFQRILLISSSKSYIQSWL